MEYIEKIDKTNLPNHIGIIMDGNGRWAKKRGYPRSFGHKAGVETIREIIKECNRLGIKYLTLYAFSTENWKRPKDEVGALMTLLVRYLKSELKELHKNNVRIKTIGDIKALPEKAVKELEKSMKTTENNSGVTMTLALNYSGRADIIKAVKAIISEKVSIDSIDEDSFKTYLDTGFMPDPDLIIRPSGEQRISNFMLWDIAYSEFWYSDVLWPDFKVNDLHKAIYDYQKRDRRFGGLTK